MKKRKTIFCATLLALLGSSCSLTLDIDGDDEPARLSVSAKGNNSDGSVSEGGYLDLDVTAADQDGISSIRIEIPALNVDFLTNSNSRLPDQKISQTFNVNEIDLNEPNTVFVTLIDEEGNSYTKTVAFVID